MQREILGSLAALVLVGTSCQRQATNNSPPLAEAPSAPTLTTASAPSAYPGVAEVPASPRPQTQATDRAHGPDQASAPTGTPGSAASIPESAAQARELMQRIDLDIAAKELEPQVAQRFKATFRGRLLAAGLPGDEIVAWVTAP